MSSPSTPTTEPVPVALATREGTGGDLADASATYTASDGTVAVAVIDGIGHEEDIVALAPVLAQVAARVGGRRGALPGLLTAALLVEGRGMYAPGPDAVAALVVARPGGPVVGVWAGDTRIYGVSRDGRLRQYSTDQTWGQQLREWGMPVDVARHGDDLIRQPLSRATAATITEVLIPVDETVIITSDGVHDQVEPDRLAALASQHANDPQSLADALVAAARANADGYRDDATALVLPRGADRTPCPEPTDEVL
jgi:PPM family protein phosphatase